MQRKTKIITAAAAAGLLTLGGLAGLASADMGHGYGMMGGGMGGGCHSGKGRCHGMMGQQMTERYDADKDGKVTQAEIDQNRQQWLAEFDADKNGTLSLEEFRQLWLKGRNQMMVREFQFLDKDGNAQVTLQEYQAPMSDMVEQRDTNNDGALGPEDRRMKRLNKGDGQCMGQGMGQGMGHGMGQGMGQGMGEHMRQGWGNSGDDANESQPEDEQAPAEGQTTP
jgi:hypothetical protein